MTDPSVSEPTVSSDASAGFEEGVSKGNGNMEVPAKKGDDECGAVAEKLSELSVEEKIDSPESEQATIPDERPTQPNISEEAKSTECHANSPDKKSAQADASSEVSSGPTEHTSDVSQSDVVQNGMSENGDCSHGQESAKQSNYAEVKAPPTPTKAKSSEPLDWSCETLAPPYQPLTRSECSLRSCLAQFCSAEVLDGADKFACEACTRRQHGAANGVESDELDHSSDDGE